jgi:copper chaperone
MKSLEVKGMSCGNCVSSVKEELSKFPNLKDIEVNLEQGMAKFETESPMSEDEVEKLKEAVKKIGFEPGRYQNSQ